ncbi:hypothetical protein [Terriglobus saanensis]|jgi:hypothetical protein|uniref:Exo-alpha-sialidase n=1 Tax=Terriglobus saanensis (strain ATCC BAA-1853 / DSM 23119 / SP1PR4) TaxID=401053 RepID=E8V376_TERSS|nr:hypothetical protein [Terriglobus saanensis]ADV82433.1 hypothetical protein AciPR4_1619 [Terriglobus saanensis SP1PR4]
MKNLLNRSSNSSLISQRASTNFWLLSSLLIALLTVFTVSASAQSLSWSASSSLGVTISGVPGRETPAAAVYNGQMYVAYTSTSVADQFGNKYVYVGSGTGAAYSGFGYINPSGGVASSNTNPSLVAFKGRLYLAFNNAAPTGTEFTDIVSFDGTSWGVVTGLPVSGNVLYSPSLATDGTYLYVALLDAATRTMTLCKSADGSTFSCTNFAGSLPDSLGYNPGLAVYNGVLYAGWVTNANSHDMYYYTSSDQGVTWTKSNALDGSQSSCAPHLGAHNGILWYDVRTNDDAHKFSQRYTTNGVSWANGADAHLAMEGEPAIQDGSGLSIFSQYFYLFYASNDGTNTLNVTLGS